MILRSGDPARIDEATDRGCRYNVSRMIEVRRRRDSADVIGRTFLKKRKENDKRKRKKIKKKTRWKEDESRGIVLGDKSRSGGHATIDGKDGGTNFSIGLYICSI